MATPKNSGASALKETVIREWPPMGKYRIRMIENQRTNKRALDIREYVEGESFEGFTRRGIRITLSAEVELLADVLKEVLDPKQNYRLP